MQNLPSVSALLDNNLSSSTNVSKISLLELTDGSRFDGRNVDVTFF